MTDLDLSTETLPDGGLRLRLAGELDMATGVRAREFADALEPGPGRPLRVDLSALDFMDSTGLGLLISLRRRALSEGWRLVLEDPAPIPSRVLQATGSDQVFTIERSASQTHS